MSDFTEPQLRALRALADHILGGQSGGAQGASRGGPLQPLPDEQLEKGWADKIIQKDPPRYQGPSFVGNRYSAATPEWHEVNASYFTWKADKGRSESPLRLKQNGKPWYESDEFEAKLSLAWARRLRNAPKSSAPASASGSDDSAWTGDEEPPPPF